MPDRILITNHDGIRSPGAASRTTAELVVGLGPTPVTGATGVAGASE
jgi:hypothetical protein